MVSVNTSFVCFSKTEHLQKIRKYIRDQVDDLAFSAETGDQIVLAIDEACANIIRHGYEYCDTGSICIETFVDKHEVVFRIKDSCPQISEAVFNQCNQDLAKPGGLGLAIIRNIMDSVKWLSHEGEGNVLELRKKLESN